MPNQFTSHPITPTIAKAVEESSDTEDEPNTQIPKIFDDKDKLNNNNYAHWIVRIQPVLEIHNVYQRTKKDKMETNKHKKAEKIAKFIITQNIDQTQLQHIAKHTSVKDIWNALKEKHVKTSWHKRVCMQKELWRNDLQEGEDPVAHIEKFKERITELAAVGRPTSNEEAVFLLLTTLPSSYDQLVMTIDATGNVPNLDTLENQIHAVYNRQQNKPREQEANHVHTSRPERKKRWCGICKAPVKHDEDYCYKNPNREQNIKNKRAKTGSNTSAPAEKPSEEHASNNVIEHFAGKAVAEAENVKISAEEWIFDSGASAHMTGNSALLTDLKPIQCRIMVSTPFGPKQPATHTGTLTIYRANTEVTLDVLLVPGMRVNLISTTAILQKNQSWTLEAAQGRMMIKKGQRMLMEAIYKDKLFIMPHTKKCKHHGAYVARTSQPIGANIELWHRRLAHRNLQDIRNLESSGAFGIIITDRDTDFGIYHCEACLRAKQHAEGRKQSTESTSNAPLELVHSDLAGPLKIRARNSDATYTISFIDDYTRYKTIYLLPNKSPREVLKALSHFITRSERFCSTQVKILRVNGGSEYKDIVDEELKKRGIMKQVTNPETPHQNGVAERFNRSLFEAVRAILASQKCHKSLWGDAALYVTHILNKLPSTSSGSLTTPYEMYFNKKPDLSNIRVFGCSVYSKMTGHRAKLDDRSHVGIFIGFTDGVKGWKILNTTTKRVTTSKNCTFVEDPDRITGENMDDHIISLPWTECEEEEINDTVNVCYDKYLQINDTEEPLMYATSEEESEAANTWANSSKVITRDDNEIGKHCESEHYKYTKELCRTSSSRKSY